MGSEAYSNYEENEGMELKKRSVRSVNGLQTPENSANLEKKENVSKRLFKAFSVDDDSDERHRPKDGCRFTPRPLGKPRKTRSVGSYMAITKAMLGSGMLSIPVLFKKSGMGLTLTVGMLQAIVSGVGFLLWGYTSWISGSDTFDQAYSNSFTYRKGQEHTKIFIFKHMLLDILLFVKTFASMMMSTTAFGDALYDLFSLEDHKHKWYGNRWVPMVVYMYAVIFPLCIFGGFKDLSRFNYVWMVGLISIVFVFVILVIDSIMVSSHNDRPYIQHTPIQLDAFWGTITALGEFCVSYMAHYIACKIYTEAVTIEPGKMRGSPTAVAKYSFMVIWAYASAALVFCAFGIVGYARFGYAVDGNILKSYSIKGIEGGGVAHGWISACWVAILISVGTSFVFVFSVVIESSLNMTHKFIEICWGLDENGQDRWKVKAWQKIVMTFCYISLVYVTGSAIKSLGLMNFILGGLIDSIVEYIVPGILLLRTMRFYPDVEGLGPKRRMILKCACWFCIAFGSFLVVTSVIGLATNKISF